MVLYFGGLPTITAAGFTVMGCSCAGEPEEKEKRGFDQRSWRMNVLLILNTKREQRLKSKGAHEMDVL